MAIELTDQVIIYPSSADLAPKKSDLNNLRSEVYTLNQLKTAVSPFLLADVMVPDEQVGNAHLDAVTLIEAPGEDKFIFIHRVGVFAYVTSAYSGVDVQVSYNAPGLSYKVWGTSSALVNSSDDVFVDLQFSDTGNFGLGSTIVTRITNKPVFFSLSGDPGSFGNVDLRFKIWYTIEDATN